jgi:hypothetical protein
VERIICPRKGQRRISVVWYELRGSFASLGMTDRWILKTVWRLSWSLLPYLAYSFWADLSSPY